MARWGVHWWATWLISVSIKFPAVNILFWAYQILAVALLAAASMTAFQDVQATEWRDVAIGEIPEIIVYRDHTRHIHPLGDHRLCRCHDHHVPGQGQDHSGGAVLRCWRIHADHGHGLGHPQAHSATLYWSNARHWAHLAADLPLCLSGIVFVGQIVGKWEEGGWIRLITLTILVTSAHLLLISPLGHRSTGANPPHCAR